MEEPDTVDEAALSSQLAMRWYHPLLSAVRLVGPLGILLYAADGHSIRDFFTINFVLYMATGITGGSLVIYLVFGVKTWRTRTKKQEPGSS